MLTRVEFERFRSLVDVTIDPTPLTVLVGRNGSGKSSVLVGIERMITLANHQEYPSHTLGRAGQVFSGPYAVDRLAHPRGSVPPGFRITLTGSEFERYTLQATVVADRPYAPAHFEVSRSSGTGELRIEYPSSPGADVPFFGPMPGLVGRCVWSRPDAAAVAEPSSAETADPHVLPDGTGVASVLQKLQLLRDGRFEAVEEGVRRVVPFIKRLRAAPAQVNRPERQVVSVDGQEFTVHPVKPRAGARIEADVEGAGWLAADQLSEGTLLVLAVLTALHDVRPRVLLLDDVDHALHPTAQGAFVDVLRRIQAELPGLQVIATTHSPFVVDHLRVEEVRALSLRDGASRGVSLHNHPKWDKRSKFLTPGEFWSAVGEDWEEG